MGQGALSPPCFLGEKAMWDDYAGWLVLVATYMALRVMMGD